MLGEDADKVETANRIVEELGDHSLTKSHERHLPAARCADSGLKIDTLENDDLMQDMVLSMHHACLHAFSSANAVKITENHKGVAFVQSAG